VTGRDGTGRDGTGRDGTGRDGTGRDGTGRDGTGRTGPELRGVREGETRCGEVSATWAPRWVDVPPCAAWPLASPEHADYRGRVRARARHPPPVRSGGVETNRPGCPVRPPRHPRTVGARGEGARTSTYVIISHRRDGSVEVRRPVTVATSGESRPEGEGFATWVRDSTHYQRTAREVSIPVRWGPSCRSTPRGPWRRPANLDGKRGGRRLAGWQRVGDGRPVE
jgi:hypothetical protein